MKKDLTLIVSIIDRSGSTAEKNLIDGLREGWGKLIAEQKALPGECKVTQIVFDDEYTVLANYVDIKDAVVLTDDNCSPRGMTSLLDAVGKTVNSVGAKLAALPEDERPEKVIFIIGTDGHENTSREFTDPKVIKEMVKHQEDNYNWKFMFLAANMDAVAEGAKLGVNGSGNAGTFSANARGGTAAYAATSRVLSSYRGGDDEAFKTMNLAGMIHDEEKENK